MFNPDSPRQPVLRGELYRRDPDAAWEQLMKAWQLNDAKLRSIRDNLGARNIPLALTECHFVIPGRDRGGVLASWAAGVSYARILNNHQRAVRPGWCLGVPGRLRVCSRTRDRGERDQGIRPQHL